MLKAVCRDSTDSVAFAISNQGNYPLNWRAVRRARGMGAEPGSIQQDIENPATLTRGAVFANERFYVAGSNLQDNYLYVLDRAGNMLDSLPQPGDSHVGFADLAWDGQRIWGSSGPTVYAMNPDGRVEQEWASPAGRYAALTWDRNRELLWVAGLTNNSIYGCDPGGNVVASLRVGDLYIRALAYYPYDPDDAPLYFVNGGDAQSSRYVISKINPETGQVTFVTELDPGSSGFPHGAEITSDYAPFTWVLVAVTSGSTDRVTVRLLDSDPTWLSLEPVRGDLETGEAGILQLGFSAAGLALGDYAADLRFTFPVVRSEAAIPISLQVVEPNGIADLRLQIEDFSLGEPSPNPFNQSSVISYQLSVTGPVSLAIYDIAGRLITNQELGIGNPGEHRAVIDGSALSSGVYLLKLLAGQQVATRKIVCVK